MGPRSWHWGVRRARERSPKMVATMRPMAEPLAPHSDQSQDCWAREVGALPSASGPGSGLCCDTDVGQGALKNKCVWAVHLDLPPSFPDWKYLTNCWCPKQAVIHCLSLYALHQVPWVEINHHTQFVRTKIISSRILSTKPGNFDKRQWLRAQQCPPCDEDWDKDLSQQILFVWGTAS